MKVIAVLVAPSATTVIIQIVHAVVYVMEAAVASPLEVVVVAAPVDRTQLHPIFFHPHGCHILQSNASNGHRHNMVMRHGLARPRANATREASPADNRIVAR